MRSKNIKLERSSKSTFTKAVKNIHGLIKKGHVKVQETKGQLRPKIAVRTEPSTETAKSAPKVREIRGSVYLSHLPNGFEENGIRDYLTQFGEVIGVSLVRSKRTGRGQGYAFVEFKSRDVAEIVAKTMNNYLMCNRLVKAKLLKPEEERPFPYKYAKPSDPEHCRTAIRRRRYLKKRDRQQTAKEETKALAQIYKQVRKLEKKLEAQGISYNLKVSRKQKAIMPIMDEEDSSTASTKDEESLVLVQDSSDTEIDFAVPDGVPVHQWSRT